MPEDIHIHVHVHTGGSSEQYTQILEGIQDLQTGVAEMAADLSGLTTEVSEQETVVNSAVALINGFGAQLDDLLAQAEAGRIDVAAVEALKGRLDASTNALAEAVNANTPEVPDPEVPEDPNPADPNPPVDPEAPVEGTPDQP